jgi:hypothetical protein
VHEDCLEKRLGFTSIVHAAFIANQLIGGNVLLPPRAYNRLLEARMRNLVTGLFVPLIVAAVSMPVFSSAHAEDCSGNPDALGTRRVLTIDPNEYPHIGAMDRAAALPLSDREVVITPSTTDRCRATPTKSSTFSPRSV